MNKIRRATKYLLDICAFGAAIAIFLVVLAAISLSGFSSYYLITNFDRLADDMVRSVAKIEAVATRLDTHAIFLNKKTVQIEKRLPSPAGGK